jgi:hypothetical protein
MNANKKIAPSLGTVRIVILLGTLAGAMVTVACSSKAVSKPNSYAPAGGTLHPAALRTDMPVVAHPAPAVALEKPKPAEKPSGSRLLTYRSRDYGVSFQYPWQYSIRSARAVANGDLSLQPVSDGHEGQFTLARVDIPGGFYADTDYESGYFMLSLNQSVDQQECESQLGLAKDGKVLTDTISGADFRWRESDNGGHGQAVKVRQYVIFSNDICYELELGVKTSNADGMAREVNPDQVLRRLDTILRTVKIQSEEKPAAEVKTSTAEVPPAPQK